MKTPQFWYSEKRNYELETLLTPLSWGYGIGRLAHVAFAAPYRSRVPVVCIGNLVAGGAGKTPTALAVMRLIKAHNLAQNPCFLTRGYGAQEAGPALVSAFVSEELKADEPKLLAAGAPTVMAKDRAAGARFAEQKGYDCIVMDDGFQNPSLHKDLSILVVDGAMGFGNGKLLPAGPLRETRDAGFARADAAIVIGNDQHHLIQTFPSGLSVFRADFKAQGTCDDTLKYFAFAGIAYPQKFYSTLRTAGLTITQTLDFADHHAFSEAELERMIANAKAQNGQLITTEKDYVRIPPKFREHIKAFSVVLEIEDHGALVNLIKDTLS